ncbi:MAG: hypothetical protein IPM98_15830 [Lewinellaceae bacterium]|nr:hypothetical protein [Lewinellaceae bacterium]
MESTSKRMAGLRSARGYHVGHHRTQSGADDAERYGVAAAVVDIGSDRLDLALGFSHADAVGEPGESSLRST